VSQSLLSLWFHVRYGASAAELGIVFGAANAVTAASLMAAPLIAERVGNLRTMVFTHVLSNVFLASYRSGARWAPAPPPVGQAGPLTDGRAHQAGLHGRDI